MGEKSDAKESRHHDVASGREKVERKRAVNWKLGGCGHYVKMGTARRATTASTTHQPVDTSSKVTKARKEPNAPAPEAPAADGGSEEKVTQKFDSSKCRMRQR